MADLGSSNRGGAAPDIYTTLIAIAAVILVAAVAYVWYRHNEVFGTYNPFGPITLDTFSDLTQIVRTVVA